MNISCLGSSPVTDTDEVYCTNEALLSSTGGEVVGGGGGGGSWEVSIFSLIFCVFIRCLFRNKICLGLNVLALSSNADSMV